MSWWIVNYIPSWVLLIGLIVLIAGGAALIQRYVRRRFPVLTGDAHARKCGEDGDDLVHAVKVLLRQGIRRSLHRSRETPQRNVYWTSKHDFDPSLTPIFTPIGFGPGLSPETPICRSPG